MNLVTCFNPSQFLLRPEIECFYSKDCVELRLNTTICAGHLCRNCSEEVDYRDAYGLRCYYTEEIHHWSRIDNSITYRALTSAKIASRLEPVGLSKFNGNGPDGMTVTPWTHGQLVELSKDPPALTFLLLLIEAHACNGKISN